MKTLRVAIEGCYPSFFDTDLVIRILHGLARVERVSRTSTHDLLIRGPFSDGNTKRRVLNRALRVSQRLRYFSYQPVSLHVSAENPGNPDYKNFASSFCDFGLGHEFRPDDPRYLRMPHWWNYIDFSIHGICGPSHWIRLGAPIQEDELMRPIQWNCSGHDAAAFIVSQMNHERTFLYDRCAGVISIDGYGKAFDPGVKNHSKSGFTKRRLLADYKYSLCPENALYPGYYTEKIPEAFVSGAIPITYADAHVSVDFDNRAFVNLADFLPIGIDVGLSNILADKDKLSMMVNTPLRSDYIKINALIDFLSDVVSAALS